MTPAPISLPKGYVLDSGQQAPQLPAGYTLDTPKPAPAGPQEPGNHFGDIIGDAIKNGPTRFMNFITGHPIEDLNKNAEAHGEAAKAAIKAGDWSTAFGHLLAGLLPGIGDEAVKAGEEFGSGNPSGGFGHAVLAMAPILGPEALERAAPYVEAAGKGVRAAAPDAASGLAKIGAGEVISKVPAMELPGRMLQWSARGDLRKVIPKGWDAFKTALDAAKAKAEPVGPPAIPPQASTPVETPSTPVDAMAQKGAAVQFTPAEEALAQHIMQSTEPQSISSALNLPASASPRVPLQPPLARPTSISLAEALRQEMLKSGTLDASKEVDVEVVPPSTTPVPQSIPTLEEFRNNGQSEPPINEGYTRLYRGHEVGEKPTNSLRGNWWTTSLEHAEGVAVDRSKGNRQVSYVDIPTSEIDKYDAFDNPKAADKIGPGESPYILPQSISLRRSPLFTYNPEEVGATESSAQSSVPQGPLDAGFRSLPANVRKTAADANYRAQQESGAGVPGGQAYEAAARANKVDPLVEHLSTKLQENGISADDAAILKNPQFKPHWAALSHDLGIKPPSSTTINAVIQELQRREATAK